MTQKLIFFIRPHINHKGEGKDFWGLITKHGGRCQCFTLYWQEKINKAKLFICFKKLISVLNVGLQTIQVNTKNHILKSKPLHGLDLCINCKIPLYPMKL